MKKHFADGSGWFIVTFSLLVIKFICDTHIDRFLPTVYLTAGLPSLFMRCFVSKIVEIC